MKYRLSLLLTLLCFSLSKAQEPLTNDSIIKMVKAGLSEDIVLSMIKTQPAKYVLTPAELISLKSSGVPDKVVAAMVEKGAGGAGAAILNSNASGATTTAGTVATGDPNDPMAAHDSGIYLYAKDRNGEYKLTVLEQASSQASKTGGGLGFALTGGIKKMKTKTVIPGQHASIRTSESQPIFYFYFEDKAAGLGKFGAGAVSNPNQFALLKLDVTKSSRETTVGEYGLSGMNTGAAEKSMVTFKSERLRSGLYRVAANGQMDPGEYCFLASQGSQIFDFAVTPNQ